MTFLERVRRALVIAPHPDDEVLGCGGTIARLVNGGAEVQVAIVTRGLPPRFDPAAIERGREEARRAHDLLGVDRTHFLDLPAAELDIVPHAEVNVAFARLFQEAAPDTVFLPFEGDIHLDHQIVFRSAMVAARPNNGAHPLRLLAYETLSETNWNAPYLSAAFAPNLFVDISTTLDRKLQAMRVYASQLRMFPDERSLEALNALACMRGATVRRHAAEAFVLLREVD